jgi:hypothetical protein
MSFRLSRSWFRLCVACCCVALVDVNCVSKASAQNKETAKADLGQRKVKRLLLLGQGPDGHPWSSHEYMAGMRILASCLQPVKHLQTIIVNADEPWKEGPELLDGADGAVVFLSQGAKWLQQNPSRLAAFKRLAGRGGGLVVIHWGMGCREAEYIDEFVNLFGGCHGGPDRRYKIVSVDTKIVQAKHPVTRGISAFEVKEEFYYTLKFPKSANTIVPLIQVPIEGKTYTVSWAWERGDGGRSFGFSGGHYHANWRLEEYRRLMTQGILWSLKISVPKEGLPLKYSERDLNSPRPKPR